MAAASPLWIQRTAAQETSAVFPRANNRKDNEGFITQEIPSSSVPLVLFRDVKKKTVRFMRALHQHYRQNNNNPALRDVSNQEGQHRERETETCTSCHVLVSKHGLKAKNLTSHTDSWLRCARSEKQQGFIPSKVNQIVENQHCK